MRNYLLILSLLIVAITCSAQRRSPGVSTEIIVDRNQKTCFEKNKVMSVRTYQMAHLQDKHHSEWQLTAFNKYDKTGHQIFWRYYSEAYDSTEYFDRHIEYNEKQQAVKQYFRTEKSLDTDKEMDLMGYDSLGRLNYFASVDTNGIVKVEPLPIIEYDKNNNPVKIIIPSIRVRTTGDWFQTHDYAVLKYNAVNKLTEKRVFVKRGEEKEFLSHKEIYTYHPNDTLRQKTRYSYFPDVGELLKTETTEFNVNGLPVKEVYYRLGIKEEITEYTIKRTYDQQNRETETITTDIYAPGVIFTRREVTEYNSSCLKVKTLVYISMTDIYPEPVLGSIIKYHYEFYP